MNWGLVNTKGFLIRGQAVKETHTLEGIRDDTRHILVVFNVRDEFSRDGPDVDISII